MRILFVAPSSYPIFGAEANVNAKVLKVFAEKGHTIDLICRTSKNQALHYPISTNDFFFGKVNSIYEIEVKTAFDLKTIFRHIRTFLKTGYIYKGIDWSLSAIKVCEKLIKNNQYDFIYTYNYPSEIVGLYITKKYGIKWVSTWNDPYMWEKYPEPYGKGYDTPINIFRRKIIKDIGKYIHFNVFPSVRLRDYMSKYMSNITKDNSIISPHIILEELIPKKNYRENDSVLKILHAGALGRERNPKILFEGLRDFLNENPNAKIEITLLGVVERMNNSYITEMIKKLNLESYIKLIPPVSYLESLSMMKDYDVCMLLEASCNEGIFLPSKVADYMQNKKIIWTISPCVGVLSDLYNKNYIKYFSCNTSRESVKDELSKMYSDFQNDILSENGIICKPFESEYVYTMHNKYILNAK